jgi:hypothetical protein
MFSLLIQTFYGYMFQAAASALGYRYEEESVNRSQMQVMDVKRFLLSSSTVQHQESQGSRHACACSEAGFSSPNGNHA